MTCGGLDEEANYVCDAFCLAVGTDYGQEAIESAAVFLFETFHNKDHVGSEETRAIKQMFGPFPASGAEACCSSVARLVTLLGHSRVEDFIQTQTSCRNSRRGSTFGHNITFSYDTYTLDPLEGLFTASNDPDEKVSLDFINLLNNQQSGKKSVAEDSARTLGSADESILRREVEKYLNGGNMISSSPEELCTSLFEMLASQRSDDELQNEVCRTQVHDADLKWLHYLSIDLSIPLKYYFKPPLF